LLLAKAKKIKERFDKSFEAEKFIKKNARFKALQLSYKSFKFFE
jgi:hypothetical protein